MGHSLGPALATTCAIALAAAIAIAPSTGLTTPVVAAIDGAVSGSATTAGDAETSESRTVAPGATFTAAERMLLKTIPWRIRKTCVPRRSVLPRGTVAAVQCKPAARVVRDMAFYLLEGGPAERVFEQRRKQAGVKRSGSCLSGKPRYGYWVGGMPAAELCYRNSDGRANLRILESATPCKQLKVAGRMMRIPTIYIAVLGQDGNLRKLARWATDDGRGSPSILTRPIDQPRSPGSPGCPS